MLRQFMRHELEEGNSLVLEQSLNGVEFLGRAGQDPVVRQGKENPSHNIFCSTSEIW